MHQKTKHGKKGIIEKSLVIMHENFDVKKKRVLMPGGKKPLFPLLFPTFLRFFVEIEGSSISGFAVQFWGDFFIVFCFICQHLANTRGGEREGGGGGRWAVCGRRTDLSRKKQGKNRKKSWIIWNSLMMECPFFLSSVFSLLFFHKKNLRIEKKFKLTANQQLLRTHSNFPRTTKRRKRRSKIRKKWTEKEKSGEKGGEEENCSFRAAAAAATKKLSEKSWSGAWAGLVGLVGGGGGGICNYMDQTESETMLAG